MTLREQIAPRSLREPFVPVLKTERLILRAPRLADARAIASLINDRRIAENLSRVPHPYGTKDAEVFVKSVNQQDGEAAFLVELHDGTLVGGCGVGVHVATLPEIGYWFGVPFWGRGYATEAARAVLAYAFETLGYEELEGGARVSNAASRRVLEKCGYVWTGVILMPVRALGASVPADRFRLDRSRWATHKDKKTSRRKA